MKINEILNESTLQEGPILNAIGRGVGNIAGTAAKGIGALAGGVAGAWDAGKKGYAAGKAQVAQAGDGTAAPVARNTAAPAPTSPSATPAQGGGPGPTAAATAPASAAPAAASLPANTGSSFSKLTTAAAGQAPAGSNYAQVKANIDKLDKKGKQRILGALQKEIGAAPAAVAPKPAAAAPAPAAVKPARAPRAVKPAATAPAAAPDAGAGAFGQMANTLANPTENPNGQIKKPAATEAPPAVWKNARNPGAPAATSPAAAAAIAPSAPAATPSLDAGDGRIEPTMGEPVAAPVAAPAPTPTMPTTTPAPVTGSPDVSGTKIGPKGRKTAARLGKQSQARANPKQGQLDLNSIKRKQPALSEGYVSIFRKR